MPPTDSRGAVRRLASRLAVRGLLVAAGVLPAACNSGPEVDPERQLLLYKETAYFHYENGDYGRAEAQALRGLELDKRDKPLRRMLGWIFLSRDDTYNLRRAEQVFEDVLDDGEDLQATLGLASTYERLGIVYERSATAIERGERFPEGGDPEARVSELRRQAARYLRQARGLYASTLTESGGGTYRAYNGLQRVTALEGDYEASLGWAGRLIELADAEDGFYRRRLLEPGLTAAEERALRGNQEASRELMRRTHLLAQALCTLTDRPTEALQHLDEAIALAPAAPVPYARRALLLYELRNYGAALADVDRYLRYANLPFDDPDVQRAYELRRYAERGDPGFRPADADPSGALREQLSDQPVQPRRLAEIGAQPLDAPDDPE